MYLGTNVTPPIIHPTVHNVNHTFSTTVVPHIHPSHTTTVNHHMFQHKHFCTHTESCCNETCNQHFNCCGPGMMPGPVGPGMMSGPAGPGFGAGPVGPGFGAGPVGPGFGAGPVGPGFGAGPWM